MIINIFFLAILLNYFFTYFLINVSKNSFLDKPNFRSMHEKPTMTGGGISFVLISVLLSFFVDNRVLIPRPETEMLVEHVNEIGRAHV